MVVLFEPRATTQYLVYVEQMREYIYQSTDLQVILDELKRDEVAQSNAFYFGARVIFDNSREFVSGCCPYMLLHITNIAVTRQAANDFIGELAMLLLHEGASISKMWFDEDMKDMKEEMKQAKTAITDASSEYLCGKYKNTTIAMFDAWSPAKRALYASNKMVDTYNRLNRFRLHGPNHTVVLALLKARYFHACVATQHASNSNKFDVNLIAMAELDAGVRGGHYDYFAYSISDEMLRMYTGVGDPYQINNIFQSVIWSNLECRQDGKRMIVSVSKSQAIFNLYTRWIALDPPRHTPSGIVPETNRLDFKQAMTILNQILRFMNVMELIDSNKQKRRVGEIPNRLLIMDKFSAFAEELDSTEKPALNKWNMFPHPISDPDVFETNPDISTIAVTAAYLPSTHATTSRRHGSRNVQPIDFTDKNKQAKGEPKQTNTIDKIEAKKQLRKEHNEKIKQIKQKAKQRKQIHQPDSIPMAQQVNQFEQPAFSRCNRVDSARVAWCQQQRDM